MMCGHDTKPFNRQRLSSQPLEHEGLSQRRVPGQMGTICSLNHRLDRGEGLLGIHNSGRWYADELRV